MTATILIFGLGVAALVSEIVSRGAITRRAWKELIRVFILMDLGAMALVRLLSPPRFLLRGHCHRCGVCCQQILAAPPRLIRDTWLFKLFLAYHRVAHNFHPVGRGPDGIITFSCAHLAPEGHCRIYAFRPLLCRNYPERPWYTAPPILPGCGFFAVPRVVARMRPHLVVLNPFVAVHHPSTSDGGEPLPEHFELVDDSGDRPHV